MSRRNVVMRLGADKTYSYKNQTIYRLNGKYVVIFQWGNVDEYLNHFRTLRLAKRFVDRRIEEGRL